MMLHPRDDDLVACADVLAAIGRGDEVDALRRAAREDDLARRRRIQKALHLDASRLIGARGALAEQVRAAVDVGIIAEVAAAQRIEDGLRLLRRGGVVEVDKRLAVDLLMQSGELLAEPAHVEDRPTGRTDSFGDDAAAHGSSSIASSSGRPCVTSSSSSSCRRTGPTLMREMMSLAKAKVSRLRASARPMPRERR